MPIVVRGLRKTYQKRAVVKDVSFEIRGGEIAGLLGANGAGKSTSFYMAVGLIRPDEGSIRIDDREITHLPLYKRARLGISYLPQESSIFRKLSVADNILVALETLNRGKKENQAAIEELLDRMCISHIRDSKGYMLSGGERRRVEVCRLLALNPRFIFFDEPFAGVDPISVSEIQQILIYLKEQGIGIFITDHNVRETLQIVDRAYIMIDGHIRIQGVPEEIVQNPLARKTYFGDNFKF